MTRRRVPEQVLDAAHARARAREAREWAEADRLRAQIEAAGWKVVDRGTDFALSPAAAPDVVEEGRVRYGSAVSVPSRLDDAAIGTATIVLVATDWPEDLDRALSGLLEHAPDAVHVVVVANAPAHAQAAVLEAMDALEPGRPGIRTEVVWTSERLGHAAALNAGIRRAEAPVVILLDTSSEPTGDLVSPLVAALHDEGVALAGPWGVRSNDLRRFEEAPPGDVDAIDLACLAFRRADYAERGPLDERFVLAPSLDVWWSFVLRDAGAGRHRRAVRVGDLPIARHERRDPSGLADPDRNRLIRRSFYRVLDQFGGRRDLLVGAAPEGSPPGGEAAP